VDALVKEFAEARYGAMAAPAAIEAYRALEDVVRMDCTIPNSAKKPIAQVAEGEVRLATVREAVEAARQDASDEKVKYNLGRLLLTLDYAIGDLRVQQMVARKDPGARDAAVKLYDMLQAHQGEGVVVTGRIKQDRLLRRLGVAVGKPAGE
jgi:hypothetical protein